MKISSSPGWLREAVLVLSFMLLQPKLYHETSRGHRLPGCFIWGEIPHARKMNEINFVKSKSLWGYDIMRRFTSEV